VSIDELLLFLFLSLFLKQWIVKMSIVNIIFFWFTKKLIKKLFWFIVYQKMNKYINRHQEFSILGMQIHRPKNIWNLLAKFPCCKIKM
jgi:hypothetical protein